MQDFISYETLIKEIKAGDCFLIYYKHNIAPIQKLITFFKGIVNKNKNKKSEPEYNLLLHVSEIAKDEIKIEKYEYDNTVKASIRTEIKSMTIPAFKELLQYKEVTLVMYLKPQKEVKASLKKSKAKPFKIDEFNSENYKHFEVIDYKYFEVIDL